MNSKNNLNIIIINYRTLNLTISSIEHISVFERSFLDSVILVDNGSNNGDEEKLEAYSRELNLTFIPNSTNLGFAKANNQAMKLASGDYIALLNSDTELTTDSFTKAMAYLEENPSVGAVGCRLITPDGKLDQGCKRGFPTPKASLFYFLKVHKWLKRPELDLYKLSHLDEHEIHEVDVISGAFMVLPRRVVEEVGMLDERFFMYGEDIDWCYRIREAGYKIVYNPKLGDVIHYKGASGKKRKFKTLYNFYEAMILFYNKHYLKKYNLLVTLLVYFGIILQFMLKLVWNYRPKFKA